MNKVWSNQGSRRFLWAWRWSRPLGGEKFFHMEIRRVQERGFCRKITIFTTGAKFCLTRKGMTLWRRIDPQTNTVAPSIVAHLEFGTPSLPLDIGRLKVKSADRQTCVVKSDVLEFEFHSDSLFFITNKSSRPVEYRHINRINKPAWNKIGRPQQPFGEYYGPGALHARMWASEAGGSLHAYAGRGKVESEMIDSDTTGFTLGDSASDITDPLGREEHPQMAHMVFPPRFFDFDGLYGEQSRPMILNFVTSDEKLDDILESASVPADPLNTRPFGIIVLWNNFYIRNPCEANPGNPFPFPIIHQDPEVKLGYQFTDPKRIRQAIAKLHRPLELEPTSPEEPSKTRPGFKVLAYFYAGYTPGDERKVHENCGKDALTFFKQQPINKTLDWMREFLYCYQLDGFYFDYAGYGRGWDDNWYDTYRFIREVRQLLGDEGYIYHHNSIDVWGGYSGLRAIMIDTYCNAQLSGETAPDYAEEDDARVDNPDEDFLRFYVSGYGLSQTFGSQISMSTKQLALSELERVRVNLENLNGTERSSGDDTVLYRSYETRKRAWLAYRADPESNPFQCIVWPPSWFSHLTTVEVEDPEAINEVVRVEINWTTAQDTEYTLSYTSNNVWWDPEWYVTYPSGPDGKKQSPGLSREHNVILEGQRLFTFSDPDNRISEELDSITHEKDPNTGNELPNMPQSVRSEFEREEVPLPENPRVEIHPIEEQRWQVREQASDKIRPVLYTLVKDGNQLAVWSGLVPGTDYRFRIRAWSADDINGTIWGHIGEFTVPPEN